MIIAIGLTSCSENKNDESRSSHADTELHCDSDEHRGHYKAQGEQTVLESMIEMDPSLAYDGSGVDAFITTVCGYKADTQKKEYWTLLVDGEFATEGAGLLVPENGSEVVWEIAKY